MSREKLSRDIWGILLMISPWNIAFKKDMSEATFEEEMLAASLYN